MDASQKRCFVLDLDGTVYLGDVPVQGTVDFIRRNMGRKEFYFLTNNTSKNLADYTNKLARFGLEFGVERILTPLLPLVDFLAEQRIDCFYPVGNASFLAFLHERLPMARFTSGEDCRAVVLGYDTELSYEKLATSCLLLQRPEVGFLVTHPDLVCPSPDGPLPDVGSFLPLYRAATGRVPDRIFGKPNASLLASLFDRFTPDEMVMVGDRLSTDKLLAENASIDFILVLSGEAKSDDLIGLHRQPSMVIDDLGELG